jgi:hypothetical protein
MGLSTPSPCSKVLLEKLIVTQLVKLPPLYGTRKFTTCLLYGPCAICVYFMSNSFLCYLYSVLKRYLLVVSSYCLCCFCFVVAAFIGIFFIFMNCSTSYRCHYKVTDSWNVCVIPPLVPILSQMNSVHAFPCFYPKIHCNIILPSTARSSEWFFPSL